MLIGYDIDGVVTAGIVPVPGGVIISGRTFAEYDDYARGLAQYWPVYIRGMGERGDRAAAAAFKAAMVELLGVGEFHEDDPLQAEVIQARNPGCRIVLHPR